MENKDEFEKEKQEILNYLHHRVMPILEPLQINLLNQKPKDVNQFSYFWLQNLKQQQNIVNQVSSSQDDQEPDQVFREKLVKKRGRRQKGREGISGQVYSTIKTQQLNKSYWQKRQQDKIKILVKLRNHIFFKNLSQKNIEQIIKCMRSVYFQENDVVIKQGDKGDELFLVDQGVFKCVVQSNKQSYILYSPGEAFGQLALLYNTKRASTITALTKGRLFSLDRSSFNAILRDDVIKKTKICQETLNKNEIFSTMKPYQKCKLIESLKQISLPAGKYIIKQGQIGDCFYIVSEGKLVAEKMQEDGSVKSVFYFKQGDYFGEIALIRNILRQASVKTLTSVKLLFMERSTFKRLLGPLQKLLKRNEQRYLRIKKAAKQAVI